MSIQSIINAMEKLAESHVEVKRYHGQELHDTELDHRFGHMVKCQDTYSKMPMQLKVDLSECLGRYIASKKRRGEWEEMPDFLM